MPKRFSCPEGALAGEIEFAIAYLVACDPGHGNNFLLAPPGGDRGEFAAQIAAILAERAESGLSGMSLER